ncbi:6244_t:CDS:2 [Entrophospora sp. SA101]|nr:6244_t:CDS:2 [Entrophospora sp. SA101]CAJ0883027.1 2801_t:CDS:2 [Entrophospora sp. SA101]CAJ0909911.1 16684_t:CDS:2 [Entrophospora sp. SA101]CAJ0915022.1 7611_t:CDS:2 [Entrophospora sp. SA101]
MSSDNISIINSQTYPVLVPRWFYATDIPLRDPSKSLNQPTDKDDKYPKVYLPFSKSDSNALEGAYMSGEAGVKIACNEDCLYEVDVDRRELLPIYWIGPIYLVVRATWFYEDDGGIFLPCDETLAVQIEEGYINEKAWISLINESEEEETDPKFPQLSEKIHRLIDGYESQYVIYTSSSIAWLMIDDLAGKFTKSIYSKFTNGENLGGIRLIRGFSEVVKFKNKKSIKELENKIKESNSQNKKVNSIKLNDEKFKEFIDYEEIETPEDKRNINHLILNNGKVSFCGHSLGSILAFDVLCHQPPLPKISNSYGVFEEKIIISENIKLDFKVYNFFAVGSPLGAFLLLKGLKVAKKKSSKEYEEEAKEENVRRRVLDEEDIEETLRKSQDEEGVEKLEGSQGEGAKEESVRHKVLKGEGEGEEDTGETLGESLDEGVEKSEESQGERAGEDGLEKLEGIQGEGGEEDEGKNGLIKGSQDDDSEESKEVEGSETIGRKIKDNKKLVKRSKIHYCYPAVRNIYNIFYKADPIAYRIEPLIARKYSSQLKPALVPYYKGGLKGMQIGFQEFGSGIANKASNIFTSVKSTFKKVVAADNNQQERAINTGANKLKGLNISGRVDYSLQEGVLDISVINALTCHQNYWTDNDFNRFIIREIYRYADVEEKDF